MGNYKCLLNHIKPTWGFYYRSYGSFKIIPESPLRTALSATLRAPFEVLLQVQVEAAQEGLGQHPEVPGDGEVNGRIKGGSMMINDD